MSKQSGSNQSQKGNQKNQSQGLTVEVFDLPKKPTPEIIKRVNNLIDKLFFELAAEHQQPERLLNWVLELPAYQRYFFYNTVAGLEAEQIKILKKLGVTQNNELEVKALELKLLTEVLPTRASLKPKLVLRQMLAQKPGETPKEEWQEKLQELQNWCDKHQQEVILFFAPLDGRQSKEGVLNLLALDENGRRQYLEILWG